MFPIIKIKLTDVPDPLLISGDSIQPRVLLIQHILYSATWAVALACFFYPHMVHLYNMNYELYSCIHQLHVPCMFTLCPV